MEAPFYGVLLKNPSVKAFLFNGRHLRVVSPSTKYLFFLSCLHSGLGKEGLSKKTFDSSRPLLG